MTILRHPFERVLSFYNHIKCDSNHYLHETLTREGLSLKELLRRKLTLECDNLQVRYLCTDDKSGVPIGTCSRAMLDQAKENLRSFAVVGFTDRFDELLKSTREHLGFKDLRVPQINIAPRERPFQDQETLAKVAEANQLDLELWEFARTEMGLSEENN